ncbi:MAG: type CRISPR-associated protein Cas8c/Csd1 [Verrucomicrobiota bacterium]|jgi:CRISPR-associated protein Csd1
MILQALNELYTRLADDPTYEIAPPGFSPQKISFRIVIRPDGSLVQIEDARIKNDKGKLVPDRMEVPAHQKRTSGVKPQFLCDKAEYLLGWSGDTERQVLAASCFNAFKEEHLLYESKINDPGYSAVCRFLEKWSIDSKKGEISVELDKLNELNGSFGVWILQGEKAPIHNSEKIKNWWIQLKANTASEHQSQCLVSGKVSPVCRIHPDIKGFKSSIALVGIQENTSYESYGLSKTENCPISSDVAFRYATALNALTDGPNRKRHRTRITDTTVVQWTDKPTLLEDIFSDFFEGHSQQAEDSQDLSRLRQLARLLAAIRAGSQYQELGEPSTFFYMLGLEQPNPGRFSIRFFHRSTIADLLDKLHDHQRCMEIIRQFDKPVGKRMPDPEFPVIWQLLRETARVAEEISPLLTGALTRSIINGTPYPEGLFSAVIRRIHADRTINYLRAALLKAVLIRNHKQTIPIMLDTTNKEPAYLLGRLFASLEKTQQDALGDLNASLRDKFYASASATPASVFPRILRTYSHHLAKLSGGSKVNRERLIQEILGAISATGFPSNFNLKSQGLFAIGYYHQRKDFFTKKEITEIPESASA